jgi:hypothetical protein
MKRKNIGSTFDSWLRDEGLFEEVSATAIKRMIACQVLWGGPPGPRRTPTSGIAPDAHVRHWPDQTSEVSNQETLSLLL